VECLFSTLQNLSHHVRIGYGDSELSYGGPHWVTPMHGICQGNRAGPAIWAVLSTPILNIVRDEGFGCTFVSSIYSGKIHFVGYSVVDDTDLIQTARKGENSEAVAKTLQESINTWEGGYKATGGAIVPENSFWYLIDLSGHPVSGATNPKKCSI
jgi:hypothetical protein